MAMAQAVRCTSHLLQGSSLSSLLHCLCVPSVRVLTSSSIYPHSTQLRPTFKHHIRWMCDDSVRWLWPADEDSISFDAGHRHGTRKGIVAVTLNTTKPLQLHYLKEAFHHLQRRIPTFRMCLRPRGDSLWFCEPSQVSVNIQMLADDDNLLEVMSKVGKEQFTYCDPVQWKAIFIPRRAHIPCPLPELQHSFPHQCDFVFTAHHALYNGMDCNFMLKCLVDILNDIIAGQPVDDSPCSVFTDRDEIQILRKNVRENLRKNTKRIDEVRKSMPSADTVPLLFETFPRPTAIKRTTRFVSHNIEPLVIKQFHEKAKKAGVSIYSALTAAVNTAIVELANEAGKVHETCTVSTYHLLKLGNQKTEMKYQLGLLNVCLSHSSHVDKNIKSNFWDYSKKLHHELGWSLNSELALEQVMVKNMDHPIASPDDPFINPSPVLHDYTLNYLGVVPSHLYENSEHVQ
ncbi:hypothetical protein Hamer_G009094 [Homarus americanus]|uniref:Condensation domain-containing protein n=2 Tax=Homarus americanus TaxID=6706 RepID=A0A8J5NB95_HOMAM|nr:hypothetical protein Hamer_G009094 [Homarus americanus]